MSLLLNALIRVSAKPSVSSTSRPPPAAPAGQRDSSSCPLMETVTSGFDSISKLADLAIDAMPPAAGATPGDDTLARQVRQLAANILATFPNGGALGLAFVSPPSSSEAPWLLSRLAQALAESASGEVLQVTDVGTLDSERSWQSWKRRFRYVIVQSDGKPNDVECLTGADGVYLVVALGKARRQSVKDCVARLHRSGVPLCGSVLIRP